MNRVFRAADLVLFIGLVGLGLWCVTQRPWGLQPTDAAALAGALFGSAAALLGNWINRINELRKADEERGQRVEALRAVIADELANVAAGLIDAKRLMDAGVAQVQATGAGLGQIDLTIHLPRPMPCTDGFGIALLDLGPKAAALLTTLRSNLAVTRTDMDSVSAEVRITHGLSLLTAMRLSNGLGHAMRIVAQAFAEIAPERRMTLPGSEDEPELASILLDRASAPPIGGRAA